LWTTAFVAFSILYEGQTFTPIPAFADESVSFSTSEHGVEKKLSQ
jgi:hypothetical protein